MEDITNGLRNIGREPEEKSFQIALNLEEVIALNRAIELANVYHTTNDRDEDIWEEASLIFEAILERNPI